MVDSQYRKKRHDMTLWIIGFLFTLGYLGYFKPKFRFWQALDMLALWPIFLGMELREQFDDWGAAGRDARAGAGRPQKAVDGSNPSASTNKED